MRNKRLWILVLCVLTLAGCSSKEQKEERTKTEAVVEKPSAPESTPTKMETTSLPTVDLPKIPASMPEPTVESTPFVSQEKAPTTLAEASVPLVVDTPSAPKTEEKIRPEGRKPIDGKLLVAFIYVGPVGDAGWSWAHDQGRKKMLSICRDIVERADFVESVPDTQEAIPVIERFAKEGYHIIFTTSYGFMDTTLHVAKKYPNTVFLHCSGEKTHTNMGNYFGKIHEADYLCGLVAGKMTKNNKIGYVAPHPIPEVIRGINAFTLGAREVNPQANVFVAWTHAWYSPEKERAAAERLIEKEGVDFMGQGQDSPTALLCAQEHDLMGTGYDSDMSQFAPHAHLTSALWDWSQYYARVVRAVKEGAWKSESLWWGMDKGLVDIAPLSNRATDEVKKIVESRRQEIIDGKHEVFTGPIHDQKGVLRVPAQQKMTDSEVWNISYFVEGVVGDIPKPIGLIPAERVEK